MAERVGCSGGTEKKSDGGSMDVVDAIMEVNGESNGCLIGVIWDLSKKVRGGVVTH